jgi:hypothetical protein
MSAEAPMMATSLAFVVRKAFNISETSYVFIKHFDFSFGALCGYRLYWHIAWILKR